MRVLENQRVGTIESSNSSRCGPPATLRDEPRTAILPAARPTEIAVQFRSLIAEPGYPPLVGQPRAPHAWAAASSAASPDRQNFLRHLPTLLRLAVFADS